MDRALHRLGLLCARWKWAVLLAARFPSQQYGSNPLVFHTATGNVTDPSDRQAIE